MLKLYRIVRRVRISQVYLEPQERLRLGEWAELFLYGTAILTLLFFCIIRIVIVFLGPEDAMVLPESESLTYRDIVLYFFYGHRNELGWNHYIAISLNSLGAFFFVILLIILILKLALAISDKLRKERSFRSGKGMRLLGKEESRINTKSVSILVFLSGIFRYTSQLFLYWYE